MQDIAQRLRSLRELNKFTQKDIADILGTTQQTYCNYENNKYETTYKETAKIEISDKDLAQKYMMTWINKFENDEQELDGTSMLTYKETSIDKAKFINTFGEKASLDILNNAGKILKTINKDTETDENGKVTIKYAGKFPTWLCPEQVRVLPISDKYVEYADKVAAELKKNGIDVTVDSRSEKIGYKIREARLDKLPYMLVVGQQEEADETVSVRSRFAGDEGVKPLDEFIEQICKEIRTKEIRKIEVEQ